MLKRVIAAVFAVSVIVPQPVAAAPKTVYPSWVDQQVREGKRCPKWEPLFRKHRLPVAPFSYLSWREARCREKATNAKWRNGKIVWTLNRNGTYDSGILQINSSWVTVTAKVCGTKWGDMTALLDANCNVAVAAYLFREAGFRPWGW